MAISYVAGTNTITVTGYTLGTPCNFTDLYNADVAGGWGVVTRQCTNQFCVDAILTIGDGSTASWFADENKMAIFSATVPSNFAGLIRSKANGHFRLGRIVDAGDKTTTGGCHIVCTSPSSYPNLFGYEADATYGHNFEFYDSILYPKQTAYPTLAIKTTNLKIYSSILHGYLTEIYNTELYKVRFHNGVYTGGNIEKVSGTISMEDIEVTDGGCFYGSTSLSGVTATVKDGRIRNSTAIASLVQNAYDNYFVNIDADTWNFNYTTYTGKAYRQYEFDLKVIDKDNAAIDAATVKIWDKDSALVVNTTTNASGVIATQTITRGYYNQAHLNTLQDASPHLIKIEKAGYTTYEADFTLDDKTDWLIALQTEVKAGRKILHVPIDTKGVMIE